MSELQPAAGIQRAAKGKVIAGWVLTAIPTLMLGFGAINALIKSPMVLQSIGTMGFSESIVIPLGAIELVCVVLYVIPRTAFYGAVLLTGYFGGAVCTHLRLGQAEWPVPVVFAMIAWAGYTLRTPRFEAFLKGE